LLQDDAHEFGLAAGSGLSKNFKEMRARRCASDIEPVGGGLDAVTRV
jgi:hypothetical protein